MSVYYEISLLAWIFVLDLTSQKKGKEKAMN